MDEATEEELKLSQKKDAKHLRNKDKDIIFNPFQTML
jgi:hypothetical protein